MKEYSDLLKLYKGLTDIERKSLKNFINILNDQKKIDESYSHRLLTNMGDNMDYVSQQLSLYGCIKTVAFRKLVQRMIEKIMDLVLLKTSIDRNEAYDERTKDILILRKRMLQYDIITFRNILTYNLLDLNKIIEKSKRYEYYDILVFALYKKRALISAILNESTYKKLIKDIEIYERSRNLFRHTEDRFNYICNPNLLANKGFEQRKQDLIQAIIDTRLYYKETGSKNIGYYFYYLTIEFYDFVGDYANARLSALHMLNYLKGNKSAYTFYRYYNALLNVINCEIKIFEFDIAKSTFDKVDSNFIQLGFNGFVYFELKLMCEFYLNDLQRVKHIIKKLIEVKEKSKMISFYSIRTDYYIAVSGYIYEKKSSKEIGTYLNQWEFTEDKWKLSKRHFQIYLLIEAEKFEQADSAIENLRKYMERLKKNDLLTKRQALIGKVLINLSRKSYDFSKTMKSSRKDIELLDSTELEYRWQIMSPEMIVFQEWFKAQVNGTCYDHGLVMERMKAKLAPVVRKPFLTLPLDANRQKSQGIHRPALRKKMVVD